MTMTAAERWAEQLAAWAVPAHILEQAPSQPYGFSPATFRAPPPGGVRSQSSVRAAEAVPPGGSVLDVGCGGGAAAFAVAPPATMVIGTDQQPDMIELFLATAADRGIDAAGVVGSWPEIAADVPAADVVVCHNVLYNVADIIGFCRALDRQARRRVVIEITGRHPQHVRSPLWKHFWDLDRPEGPTSDDAVEALRSAGFAVNVEASTATARDKGGNEAATMTRRLCLPAEREPEVAALIEGIDFPADRVVIWWDTDR